MISYENWIVAPYDENIYSILHFLLPEFSRIFSPDIMRAETCTVFNDPSSKCPMLIISRNPIQIQLSQKSTQYWAQTIYQLSHEMCHYAIRQGHKGDSYILSWLEETICEAISLYALEWASHNWYRCPLSMGHSEYSSSIFTYLKIQQASRSEMTFRVALPFLIFVYATKPLKATEAAALGNETSCMYASQGTRKNPAFSATCIAI